MKKTVTDFKSTVRNLAVTLLLAMPLAFAQAGDMKRGEGMMESEGMMNGRDMAQEEARDAQGRGEVIRLDRAAGQIKLRHGPMPALDWPAMTMSFPVEDPAMLEGLKEGDEVDFEVHMDAEGNTTVTRIESR